MGVHGGATCETPPANPALDTAGVNVDGRVFGVLPTSAYFNNLVDLLRAPYRTTWSPPFLKQPSGPDGSGMLEVTFAMPGFLKRFQNRVDRAPKPSFAAPPNVNMAVIAIVARVLRAFPSHLRVLVLGAWQFNVASHGHDRDYHHDNANHGDLIVTVTLEGSGLVDHEHMPHAVASSVRQKPADFYGLWGDGLSRARHAATASATEGRTSLTLRFVPASAASDDTPFLSSHSSTQRPSKRPRTS